MPLFVAGQRQWSGVRNLEEKFWARSFYVSTVELDEETIHIRHQEEEDKRIDQLSLV